MESSLFFFPDQLDFLFSEFTSLLEHFGFTVVVDDSEGSFRAFGSIGRHKRLGSDGEHGKIKYDYRI